MDTLRKIPFVKYCIVCVKAFTSKYSLKRRFLSLTSFLTDYAFYKKLPPNKNFQLLTTDLYPQIFDKTSTHNIDYVYFYQDSWCAGKVFQAKPSLHYDIGSKAEMVGIISQFTETVMVDIRPLSVSLPGLSFTEGSILQLPFADNEIGSLSSICVIEHIGLGRYGDPLDQFGTEKAAQELARVLKSGGDLYVSVPIDKGNITYFNAHRAFTREYFLSLFPDLTVIEEKYIYGNKMISTYEPASGFGTGLFHLRKI